MNQKLALAVVIIAAFSPLSAFALSTESIPRLCPGEWQEMSNPGGYERFSLSSLSLRSNSMGDSFFIINNKTNVAELETYRSHLSAYVAGRRTSGGSFSGWDPDMDRAAAKLAVCIAQKRIDELQGTPFQAGSQKSGSPVPLPDRFPSTDAAERQRFMEIRASCIKNNSAYRKRPIWSDQRAANLNCYAVALEEMGVIKVPDNELPKQYKKNQTQNGEGYGAIAVYMPSPDRGNFTAAMRTQEEADRTAINHCLSAYSNFHDKSCDIVVRFRSGQCGAYAAPDQTSQYNTVFGGVGLSYNGSKEEASRQAMDECIHRSGATNCKIKAAACN